LLVQLVSQPALEIWLQSSLAGIRRSAKRSAVLGQKHNLEPAARIAGSRSMVVASLYAGAALPAK
jgi:hypothetical protein